MLPLAKVRSFKILNKQEKKTTHLEILGNYFIRQADITV